MFQKLGHESPKDEIHLRVNRCQLLARHYLMTYDPGDLVKPTAGTHIDTNCRPKLQPSGLERCALAAFGLMKHLLQIALHVGFLYINTTDCGIACSDERERERERWSLYISI